jgi:hypothetical protein
MRKIQQELHNKFSHIQQASQAPVVVLFWSGLHIASACGTNGEHVAAPAAEAESYIRLRNIYNS